MENKNNLDKQYLDLLNEILINGVTKADRTGTGTISVFGRQIRHQMSDGFPALTTKKLAFQTMVTELLWFLRGGTCIKYLVDNDCHIWDGDAWVNYSKKIIANNLHLVPATDLPKTKEEFINRIKTDDEFAKEWGDLGKIYGFQWRNWTKKEFRSLSDGNFGYTYDDKPIDQIQNLINELKTNPDSRRMLVNAWAVHDLTDMTLPPCHYGFQTYTRELTWKEQVQWVMKNTDVEWENLYIVEEIAKDSTPKRAISLMFNMRSTDVPLGLPFNIASYGLLLTLLGKMTNMIPDELIASLGDAHIYKNQIDGIKEQLTREPRKLPLLEISDEVNFSGTIDDFLNSCAKESFKLLNYDPHPAIKIPLSN
jgi:thymidylate synthase